jgi:hypothetical protein
MISLSSVADPGCLSRILIFVHPGSRFPDPKTVTKERGEKKLVLPFFVTTKITIEIYLTVELVKKKIWANLQRIMELYTQKSSLTSNMSLGSEIWDPEKPYSGSRIQGSKRHRIRICNNNFHIHDPYP